MVVVKKYISILLIIVLLLGISNCNAEKNIEAYEEYEKNSIVKITISTSAESYYFICTDDYQIVTYDRARDKIRVTDLDSGYERQLDSMLTSIIEDDSNIESEAFVGDYYQVDLFIADKEYWFTYGLSANPYVNMLVEFIIDKSDYKPAQESLVPYPSTFRQDRGRFETTEKVVI